MLLAALSTLPPGTPASTFLPYQKCLLPSPTPCVYPSWGPAQTFISIQVSHICPYLCHCLLLSLMHTLWQSFLCAPHATPAPDSHGRAPVPSPTFLLLPLLYLLSVSIPYSPYSLWVWLHLQPNFASHSSYANLLPLPFSVTPCVTVDILLLCL